MSCLRRGHPWPYQLQAAVNAVHSDAPTAADTDWHQIVALYDQHLALVEDLGLDGHHLYHALHADLLHRLGRDDEAALAYEAAIARAGNRRERDPLRRRSQTL